MVKLASARETRQYGPSPSKTAWECINATLYLAAGVVLVAGFVLQLPPYNARAGMCLLLIALAAIFTVNLHDLFAHLAGIDYRLPLLRLDTQFGLVEVSSPLVQAVGAMLFFIGTLILLLEDRRGYERHALGLLIAGPAMWVCGSIHNAFQVYERADSIVQVMQSAVYLPFLIASVLYLVAGILNIDRLSKRTSTRPLGQISAWLGIVGSGLLVLGGVFNLVKVLRVQHMDDRLETLRGVLQERLSREREGSAPLLSEEHMRKRMSDSQMETPIAQTYKDAVVRSKLQLES